MHLLVTFIPRVHIPRIPVKQIDVPKTDSTNERCTQSLFSSDLLFVKRSDFSKQF